MDNQNMQEEQEIDLIELVKGLWNRKMLLIKCGAIGAVVGLVVAFSIPKEYSTSVKLAPEVSSSSKMGGLGGLAAMAGISMGSSDSGDAINAPLYPDVVQSIPFVVNLFDLDLEFEERGGEMVKTNLYDYMDQYQRAPWWSAITAAPFKLLGAVMSIGKEEVEEPTSVDIAKLSIGQYEIIKALRQRISLSVDSKTFMMTVNVKMQDPDVAYAVAKVVVENLQSTVTEYRTQKVKNDLIYTQKAHDEAKQRYYDAQREYARFQDENKNITSSRYLTESERLNSEMNLLYNVYLGLANGLEQKKLKLQEATPVYATLEPATRPTDDSEPNKPMILIAFTFLAGIGAAGWVIFKDKLIEF